MSIIEHVTEHMRSRLAQNREGRLTSDQWKDMVTEPLTVLLLLMVPVVIFIGPRVLAFGARGLIFVLLTALLVMVIPLIFRARRYARAAVQFERLYAGDNPTPITRFWQPLELYSADGQPIRFKKRLAPYTLLHPNRSYLVYYLREHDHNVLLSLAPAEHPEVDKWLPTTTFYNRQAQRVQH